MLEITIFYCDYLNSIPLDASLEGINMKFDCLLKDVESLKLGLDTQKSDIRHLAKATIPPTTGKGASWAQVVAILMLLLSLTYISLNSNSISSLAVASA